MRAGVSCHGPFSRQTLESSKASSIAQAEDMSKSSHFVTRMPPLSCSGSCDFGNAFAFFTASSLDSFLLSPSSPSVFMICARPPEALIRHGVIGAAGIISASSTSDCFSAVGTLQKCESQTVKSQRGEHSTSCRDRKRFPAGLK